LGGLATLAIAELGHLLKPGLWWAPLPVGAVLAVVALWRCRGRERWFMVGGALFVGGWAAAWWKSGVSLPLFVGLGVVTLVATVWWHRYRVRGRIDIVGEPVRLVPLGEWWKLRKDRVGLERAVRAWRVGLTPTRAQKVPAGLRLWWADRSYRRRSKRELGWVLNNWHHICRWAEIRPGRVSRATADRLAYVLEWRLQRGTTQAMAMAKQARLESALQAVEGTVTVEPIRMGRANRVRVRWLHHHPMEAGVLPWDPDRALKSIHDPLWLGLYRDGREATIRMDEPVHTTICGTTRWGKTTALRVLIASLVTARDVCLIVIEPKGFEFKRLASKIAYLGRHDKAEATIRGLRRVAVERGKMLRESGKEVWDAELGPWIVVPLDEINYFPNSARAPVKDELLMLARRCLYVGIFLITTLQDPDAKSYGNTALRDNSIRRICLKLMNAALTRELFGPEAEKRGWRPHDIPAPGDFYLAGDGLQEPMLARFVQPSPEQLDLVAERATRTELDERSRAAFLSTAYPEADEDELRAMDADEGDAPPAVTQLRADAPPPPAEKGFWGGAEGDLLTRMVALIHDAPDALSGREIQRRGGKGPDGRDVFTTHFLYQRKQREQDPKEAGALREAERQGLIVETTKDQWTWRGEGPALRVVE
jgi:hypothetical protein